MSETFGDACDELLRRVDKLETANGKLCESVNQLTHMVEERDESINNLIGLVDKLTAERERYRSLFGKALDFADEIIALGMEIDEGMA